MANTPDNLVLEHLRHIRADMKATREDIQMLTLRMGSVERILAGHQVGEASQSLEIDRLRLRVDRIERRLELSEPTGPL
jgi:hypothetical protein